MNEIKNALIELYISLNPKSKIIKSDYNKVKYIYTNL